MKTFIQKLAEADFRQLIPLTFNLYTGEPINNTNDDVFDNDFDNYNDYADMNDMSSDDYYNYSKGFDGYDTDDYLFNSMSYSDEQPNKYKDEEDEYYDDDDLYSYSTVDDNYKYEDVRPRNLEDLKDILNCSHLSNEEFLKLSISDIFGISQNQLKFIPIDLILTGSLETFARYMKNKDLIEEIPDVEQRIKYATMVAIYPALVTFSLPMCDNVGFHINAYATEIGLNLRDVYEQVNTKENKEKLKNYLKRLIFNTDPKLAREKLKLLNDYYNIYGYGLILNKEREMNNEEIVYYEVFPHFAKIKEMHDKAMRDNRVISDRFEAIEKEKIAKRLDEVVNSIEYKRFFYTNGKYSIIGVKDYDDLIREGKTLNHCVAQYASDFSEQKTYIYFLRRNDSLNKPFYTIELKPDAAIGFTNDFCIEQCYSIDNTTDKDIDCQQFIYSWAAKFNFTINCTI